jgi:MFS superfamily sulfate permease-like transporter
MAGLFAAIIGGIVVSQVNGSFITINGAAAGLIVVILTSVERLGGGDTGYHCTLAAIVVAGIALIILGKARAGVLGNLVPATVVHGMLAAIGLIIIAKEIPIFLGVSTHLNEPIAIYENIPGLIKTSNPEIAVIGIAGLLVLILYNLAGHRVPLLKSIPAPLMVVAVGISIGSFFDLQHAHQYVIASHHYSIDPKQFLVQLPPSILDAVAMPNWNKLGTQAFWYSAIAIILIQGMESLLSCAAVEKLDPYKRTADLSRDLVGVGIGTTLSGMLGGIPVIAEIVRSTANVASGARTRWSNFFHGLFVLLFVLVGASIIDLIPQAALAALLIMVGFRLASPKEFQHIFEIGPDQLFLYCVTIIAVLQTDLLIGVVVGIMCKFMLHILNGAPLNANLLFAKAITTGDGAKFNVAVNGVAVFSNYLSLKNVLDKVPEGKELILDMSKAILVDHSTMDHLTQYKREYEKRGGTVVITGLSQHKSMSSHRLSSRKLSVKY